MKGLVIHMRNHIGHCREEDMRSERRIRNNRRRRKREMRKNFLLIVMTICLIAACSISMSVFRSSAKDDSVKTSYKYYKSITISNNDTLWSIAEEYMDEDYYDSVNDYVDEVIRVNTLPNDTICYGQHLIIPYYDELS